MLLAAGLQKHYYPATGEYRSTEQHSTYALKRVDEPRVAPVTRTQAPPPNPKPKRDEWRSEQDLQAQWNMAQWALVGAIAALLSVVVTCLGVWLVRQTLVATREMVDAANRTANEAKRIGEAQVRAYLTVTGGTYEIWGEDLRIEVHFHNAGASPARNISGRFNATIMLDDTQFPIRTHACSDVAAQGTGLIMGLIEASDDHARRFCESTSKRGLGFGVEGVVQWSDVFDARNEQPFRLSSRFEKTDEGIDIGRLELSIIGEEVSYEQGT